MTSVIVYLLLGAVGLILIALLLYSIQNQSKTTSSAAVALAFQNAQKEIIKMAQLTDIQTLPLSLVGEDVDNQQTASLPAFDAPPTWSVDNPAIGSVAAAADGMSAVFTPANPVQLGSCNVQAAASVGGVAFPCPPLPVTVTASAPTQMVIQAGTPS